MMQQSPYAAHLNFKVFENFFDVEIQGMRERSNGKTIFKLKKINPQKKSYQYVLEWMIQNQ